MKRVAVGSIALAVMLLALAIIAEAQQPKKIPRIGFLGAASPTRDRREAFREGLRELIDNTASAIYGLTR